MVSLSMRIATNQSKIAKAKPDTISVRTTIPANIAKKLRLNVGDVVEWDTDKSGNVWFATVKKV